MAPKNLIPCYRAIKKYVAHIRSPDGAVRYHCQLRMSLRGPKGRGNPVVTPVVITGLLRRYASRNDDEDHLFSNRHHELMQTTCQIGG